MSKPTDIRVREAALYALPVETRVPLKFGAETLTSVTCARVRLRVEDRRGRSAVGWGETPLSVQWVWPSGLPYADRLDALTAFCKTLCRAWAGFDATGHPMEVGTAFQEGPLHAVLDEMNRARAGREPMPWLAALVCCSAFDLALHDAYGCVHGVPTYATYTSEYMTADLADFLEPAAGADISFAGRRPGDYLAPERPDALAAWHLVGGADALEPDDVAEDAPDDGYPVCLADWIARDGLTCLKVKLRGDDAAWDYDRLARVGDIAARHGCDHLSADFNCTVKDPAHVVAILDRLQAERRDAYERILYVEQPFPYDLAAHPIDVREVSARKPLFMDESAHDWRLVRMGRSLGWTGVALKTCKTQTGALLAQAWAKAHGMALMVQDLTNPMLAQIPHVLLGAYAGTIMGVETNAMQFYPEASRAEGAVHPGLYRRRDGRVTLDTIRGPGFGYRVGEIARALPAPIAAH